MDNGLIEEVADYDPPEKTEDKCPECGTYMLREMDRHQSYIYTCPGCGHTESE